MDILKNAVKNTGAKHSDDVQHAGSSFLGRLGGARRDEMMETVEKEDRVARGEDPDDEEDDTITKGLKMFGRGLKTINKKVTDGVKDVKDKTQEAASAITRNEEGTNMLGNITNRVEGLSNKVGGLSAKVAETLNVEESPAYGDGIRGRLNAKRRQLEDAVAKASQDVRNVTKGENLNNQIIDVIAKSGNKARGIAGQTGLAAEDLDYDSMKAAQKQAKARVLPTRKEKQIIAEKLFLSSKRRPLTEGQEHFLADPNLDIDNIEKCDVQMLERELAKPSVSQLTRQTTEQLKLANIKSQAKSAFTADPDEKLTDSMRFCIPRFFCCMDAPAVFQSYRLVVALVLSLILGSLFSALQGDGHFVASDNVVTLVNLPSDIALRFFKLMYGPLLFVTVAISVGRLYISVKVAPLGRSLIVYMTFLMAFTLAIVAGGIGVLFSYTIMVPWNAANRITAYTDFWGKYTVSTSEEGVFDVIFGDEGIILTIAVSNMYDAFESGNTLAILLFAYILGKTASFQADRIRPVLIILEAIRDTILAAWPRKITAYLVFFSIFSAMFETPTFFEIVADLWPFLITDLVAILSLTYIVVPAAVLFLGFTNPGKLFFQMFTPLITAFGTASSGAAYPLAQFACRSKRVVRPEVSDFCLPLLNVISRPGTVVHIVVSVFYHGLVQENRVLSFVDMIVVLLLTPILATSGASLPSSSLVTQVTVLNAIGLQPDSIYLLVPVDFMLDRFRTMLNIWGDIGIASTTNRFFLYSQLRHEKQRLREASKKAQSKLTVTDSALVDAKPQKPAFAKS